LPTGTRGSSNENRFRTRCRRDLRHRGDEARSLRSLQKWRDAVTGLSVGSSFSSSSVRVRAPR
jgi:hypothetical protein